MMIAASAVLEASSSRMNRAPYRGESLVAVQRAGILDRASMAAIPSLRGTVVVCRHAGAQAC
jgi:hypothetical protein